MLRVDITAAKAGMRLALPVRHPQMLRQTLLRVGFALDAESLARLSELGIRSLWVQYPSLSFLEKLASPEVQEGQDNVVSHIARSFETMQRQATARLPFETYTKSIGDLVQSLVGNPQAAVFLGDLAGHASDDLMRHSSNVTYLSLLMGLKLEGYLVKQRRHVDPARAKEVINLGIGAMLHDMGVTQLTAEVRQRYRQTGNEADPEWKTHPALGYLMVRGRVEPSAATVVLNHHQRYDGSGYAGGDTPALEGSRIHVFARIVALADQFDRLRTPPNLPAQPTVWALASILSQPMARKFDPEVIRALLCVVPPYPPGTVLQLNDGQWAVAIDHNAHDPCRPVVQLIPDPKDLSSDDQGPAGPTINLAEVGRHLHVAKAEGFEVADLNFQAPALMQSELAAAAW